MIYIGSPYSSPAPSVRDDRAYQVGAFAAHCAQKGLIVYCPIASWHHLAQEHALPRDFAFWRPFCLGILRFSTQLWVLRLDGWDESSGLTTEMDFAQELKITTRHFDGDNFQEVV